MDALRHRKIMNKHVQKLLASKRAHMISDEKNGEIVTHLKNPTASVDPHFRHWVKSKKFQLMDIPALCVSNALVLPAKPETAGETVNKCVRVVAIEKLFEVMKTVHESEMDHAGYKKCSQYVSI